MPRIDLFSEAFCQNYASKKQAPGNESRVLIFYRSKSSMVRTKNVPTKQIVAEFA